MSPQRPIPNITPVDTSGAGGFHDLRKGSALGSLNQAQDSSRLAALADGPGLLLGLRGLAGLGGLRRFRRFLRRGGLRARLSLRGRALGGLCANFKSSSCSDRISHERRPSNNMRPTTERSRKVRKLAQNRETCSADRGRWQ
jgi:hypothetical protein